MVNSDRKLKIFPRQIFHYNQTLNLEDFTMTNYNISHLPENAFGSAAGSLKHISLMSLHLKSVSKCSFDGCDNLESLFLLGNQVHQFPDGVFSPLVSMVAFQQFEHKQQYLNLSDHNFSEFRDMKIFLWANASLTAITGRLCKPRSALQYVKLNANRLQHLGQSLFKDCTNLTFLEFRQNMLTMIPEGLLVKTWSIYRC